MQLTKKKGKTGFIGLDSCWALAFSSTHLLSVPEEEEEEREEEKKAGAGKTEGVIGWIVRQEGGGKLGLQLCV